MGCSSVDVYQDWTVLSHPGPQPSFPRPPSRHSTLGSIPAAEWRQSPAGRPHSTAGGAGLPARMPLLDLKPATEKRKKKRFKFLTGVFGRESGSRELEEDLAWPGQLYGTEQPVTPARSLDIEEEMENLHLSRRDNPYLSSCEALDDMADCEQDNSPRLSVSPPAAAIVSPHNVVELHSHLVRSPPPVHWPGRAADCGDWAERGISPESECERSRSRSVERIISPGSGALSPVRNQTPALSPARGATPDLSPPPTQDTRPAYNRSDITNITNITILYCLPQVDQCLVPPDPVQDPGRGVLAHPVQHLHAAPARPVPHRPVQVVLPGDLAGAGVPLPAG